MRRSGRGWRPSERTRRRHRREALKPRGREGAKMRRREAAAARMRRWAKLRSRETRRCAPRNAKVPSRETRRCDAAKMGTRDDTRRREVPEVRMLAIPDGPQRNQRSPPTWGMRQSHVEAQCPGSVVALARGSDAHVATAARFPPPWHGSTRHGTARHCSDTARLDAVRHGSARRGSKRLGSTRFDTARLDTVRHGSAR